MSLSAHEFNKNTWVTTIVAIQDDVKRSIYIFQCAQYRERADSVWCGGVMSGDAVNTVVRGCIGRVGEWITAERPRKPQLTNPTNAAANHSRCRTRKPHPRTSSARSILAVFDYRFKQH